MAEQRDWDWERRRRIVRERGADPVDEAAPFPEWTPDEPTYALAPQDQAQLDAILRALRVSDADIVRAASLEDPRERRKELCTLLRRLDKNQALATKLLRGHVMGDAVTRERMKQRLDVEAARFRNAIRHHLDMPQHRAPDRLSPSKMQHFPVSYPPTTLTGPTSKKHAPLVRRRLTDADRARLGLRPRGTDGHPQ